MFKKRKVAAASNKQIEAEVDSFNFVHSGVVVDLEMNSGHDLIDIDEPTRLALGKQLADGYAKADNALKMTERARSIIDISEDEAELLVRTEYARAFHNANMEAARKAGVTQFKYLAIIDNWTCPECRADHEKIFHIDDLPPIPRHKGCRCTVVSHFE